MAGNDRRTVEARLVEEDVVIFVVLLQQLRCFRCSFDIDIWGMKDASIFQREFHF